MMQQIQSFLFLQQFFQMGNIGNRTQDKNSYNEQLNKLNTKVLYEFQAGQIVSEKPLDHKKTATSSPYILSQYQDNDRILFHRQFTFHNQQTLLRIYNCLRQYEKNQQSSQTCSLVGLTKTNNDTMCSSSYSLDIYLQFSDTNLFDETQARMQSGIRFDFEDCNKIINTTIRGLNETHRMVQQFEIMGFSQLINSVFINPKRIILMPSGMIKIMNPLMVSSFDRDQYQNSFYYSPEKMTDFNFDDDVKSSIFELGITLVHLLALQDCHDIYNGFQVQQEVIDSKILDVWEHYRSYQICELLTNMTRVVRSNRFNLKDCILFIDTKLMPHATSEQFFTNTYTYSGFYVNTDPFSNTIPSGRTYNSDCSADSSDRLFPKEKTGVFKQKKKPNYKKNLICQNQSTENSHKNNSIRFQSLMKSSSNRNRLIADKENALPPLVTSIELRSSLPISKENKNKNIQESIVKSRTRFCKKNKLSAQTSKQSIEAQGKDQYIKKEGRQNREESEKEQQRIDHMEQKYSLNKNDILLGSNMAESLKDRYR